MNLGRAKTPITDDPLPRVEAAFVGRIGAARYQLWFASNAKFVWLEHEFVVVARTAHFQDWAADKFGPALRDAVAEACGQVPVRFVTDADLFAEPSAEPKPIAEPVKPTGPKPQLNLFGEPPAPPTPKEVLKRQKDELQAAAKHARKWKTFAEFAVGPSNRVAHAAAVAVAEEPGLGPNPLVLHGPVGTGKTHLLEGIHSAMRKRGPEGRALFVTAEEFTNRFVQSNRFNKMGTFRKQFRECSALLLDDLNFLENKKATQEEFLHTLDALVSDGRQVVVTTDCHPRLADKLIPELVDRLLGGAAWSLLPPDDETRLDILRRKAANSPIGEDVLKFLARNLKGNVRELEGAINSVRHFAKVTGQPVTVSLAREALGDLLRHVVRAITVADVDAAVCRVLRLSVGQLQSKSRSWQVSHPRMIAVYLARKHTAATYGEIAKHFGVKQHSTAVAGEKKVRSWLTSNEQLNLGDRRWTAKDLIDRVERELQK
ncbi:DnaA ATPase domain-containing protein [Limnoglobus roseus]|uniref:Chromosomal replication initiator protein DnaA n=1 Tax=Limnoglobus roseus TaxID=2598579 RepID=A0A5C1AC06_9BACT|nr:DnaA/Hda family protein [Limnoglobus roseus]QEL15332.1 chromosome replication initiation protein [Limnoglobus roseus]